MSQKIKQISSQVIVCVEKKRIDPLQLQLKNLFSKKRMVIG